jgi:hypothetical protein
MSKERLTARVYYCKLNNVDIPWLNPKWNINDIFSFAEAFAAQEVEAAIAETKKQRDELLNTLIDIRNKLYLTEKNGDICFEIAEAAITNAQEK